LRSHSVADDLAKHLKIDEKALSLFQGNNEATGELSATGREDPQVVCELLNEKSHQARHTIKCGFLGDTCGSGFENPHALNENSANGRIFYGTELIALSFSCLLRCFSVYSCTSMNRQYTISKKTRFPASKTICREYEEIFSNSKRILEIRRKTFSTVTCAFESTCRI
jgi:hypothetical protein